MFKTETDSGDSHQQNLQDNLSLLRLFEQLYLLAVQAKLVYQPSDPGGGWTIKVPE